MCAECHNLEEIAFKIFQIKIVNILKKKQQMLLHLEKNSFHYYYSLNVKIGQVNSKADDKKRRKRPGCYLKYSKTFEKWTLVCSLTVSAIQMSKYANNICVGDTQDFPLFGSVRYGTFIAYNSTVYNIMHETIQTPKIAPCFLLFDFGRSAQAIL